jgi:hypothetical protein
MPCVAQFGIIDQFEKDKDYSKYEPKKYNCITIDDNYLSDWNNDLAIIKSYFHSYNRPEFGLARWGITLIPPESVGQLFSIVSKDKRSKKMKN